MILNKEPLICRNQPKAFPPPTTTTKTPEPETEEVTAETAKTEKITADDDDLREFECENWEDLVNTKTQNINEIKHKNPKHTKAQKIHKVFLNQKSIFIMLKTL